MHSGYLLKDSVDKLESLSKWTCGLFFKRIYYSGFMQIIYTLLVLLCISCTTLNLLTEISDPNNYISITLLEILEICLSILITGEIALRTFSEKKSDSCSIMSLIDYTLLALSFISIFLCFHQEYIDHLGDNICDTLLIGKSALFVVRVMFVCSYVDETKLGGLNISLYDEEDDEYRRSIEQAKIRYRYRPTMAILIEEDEEDDEEEKLWRGESKRYRLICQ
ncbi:hypothetical protein SteCoe_19693 [Stentor coeruleus]|uniref:Ion transport domain-containing protein n=1 Tax=Stentor coeruleus TaxID=5963 RepID=A0A1R2BTL4_9CILI|nr:hypothetical protein SteCoe_19693 [Stentor coeruleus]